MRIGEKIKSLRTAKMMTQSELAGDSITRNMLSQIENGSALPSLPTLVYLAERLKVPAGYLIADEGSEAIYLKINNMENIKRAYMSGEYRMCRSLCLGGLDTNDDEIALILAGCSVNIAKSLFAEGRIRSAAGFFDEAVRYCALSAYYTDNIISEISVYFRYLNSKISHTVYSEESIPRTFDGLSFSDPFCRFVVACEKIENGNDDATDEFDDENAYLGSVLEAKKLILSNDYKGATVILQTVLRSENVIITPLLYDILCDLEVCCREISDYKSAYEYASSKMSVLEKMLSDDGYGY
ncbi:MAG: helix-turn-helix transcriptional regulator [Clostridia bacterium]|nr:helix-turn-helix transcriptional regulator [Clostridia bacterium]